MRAEPFSAGLGERRLKARSVLMPSEGKDSDNEVNPEEEEPREKGRPGSDDIFEAARSSYT